MNHVSGYSQIVVRTGVEHSFLLSRDRLHRLAETENLRELTANLKGTPYENPPRTFSEPVILENIQRAFQEELFRLYAKTVRLSPAEVREFLREYISHLEAENLKTLLRAKNSRLSYETTIGMLHLSIEETLGRREVFVQAAKAGDIDGAIKSFSNTRYARALSKAKPMFEKTKSTRFFDLALDRAYYEHLMDSKNNLNERNQRLIMPIIGAELDLFNIGTIVRSKLLGYPPEWIDDALTTGFYELSMNDVRALTLVESATSAVTVLKQTSYKKSLIAETPVEETLTHFEEDVKKHSLKYLDETRLRDPFNIVTPFGIMFKKEVEIENLTRISSGIEHNWAPEEITSTLI